MTVVVLGTVRVDPENVEPILPHLRAFVDATVQNDGCLAYDVAQDLFDPGLIRFSEIWPDEEALARHLKAPHTAPWRAAGASLGARERKFIAYDGENPRPI